MIAMEPAHLIAAGPASSGLPDVQLISLAVILVFLAGLASMADAALATVSPARAGCSTMLIRSSPAGPRSRAACTSSHPLGAPKTG